MSAILDPILRHPAEHELLQHVIAGSPGAVDAVITQVGSVNPWLQQIMVEAIQDSGSLVLWRRLLDCLAFQRWDGHPDSHRRSDRAASQRIDLALLRLFVEDEHDAPSTAVKLEALHAGLRSAEPRLRITAGVALGLRGDRHGLEALIDAVHTGDREDKLRAVQALGRLKDERSSLVLVEALASDDEALHYEASRALGQIGPPAVPALIQALRLPKAHVRWHAVRTLGAIGDPAAATGLAEALADDDYSVRWAAADALLNLGHEAVPKILERLARYMPHDDSYQAARHALHRIQIRHPDLALESLLKALAATTAPAEAPMLAYRLLQEWDAEKAPAQAERP
jgi:HEAT repeat protein